MPSFARRLLLPALGLALFTALLAGPAPAAAQGAGSVDYLIRLLSESDSFRVRVRAADALGSQTPSAAITTALIGALDDAEPAVRVAAASSLGRVGDASALSALRGLSSDSESAVREAASAAVDAINGRSGGGSGSSGGGSSGGSSSGGGSSGTERFYVGIGPGSGVTGSTLSSARSFMSRSVDGLSGVVLAPDGESDSAARRVLSSRHLSGFYLDWTISTTASGSDTRIRVEVVIQDYPGRNIIAMANSATTMPGTDMGGSGPYIEAIITAVLRQVSSQFR